jgi:photosystem II stability/assembly factor-like uncharacterized protein
MKKLIISFLISHFSFLISQGCMAQDWQWQNPLPQGNTLKCIKFIDDDTGYAVGDAGTIIRTTNAGADWNIEVSGTLENLNAVHLTGQANGIAVGNNGLVLKTTDGVNWSPRISGTTESLHAVHFTGPDTGYAVGNNGTIIKTMNGGEQWAPLASGTSINLFCLWFIDNINGFVAGDEGMLLKTSDGGHTWEEQNPIDWGTFYSVFFTDSSTGYLAGGYSGADWDYEIIYKTSDGGLTWTIQHSDIGNYLLSVCFINQDTGFAAGGLYHGTLLRTINGGADWIHLNIPDPSHHGIRSLAFTDDSTVYMAGLFGRIIKTTGLGEDLVLLTSGTNFDIASLCFPSPDTGYAAGYYYSGRNQCNLLRTTDGGSTWAIIHSDTNDYYSDMFFTDNQTGYAVGTRIMKTTEGGDSWTVQAAPTTDRLSSVFFLDANTGFVAGDNGAILKTANGGTTWTNQSSMTSNWLHSIFFVNENVGYAVGRYGTIRKTINGGTQWIAQSGAGSENILNDVWFTDEENGFIVGGQFLRTQNGGISWQIEQLVPGYLESIFFTDPLTGYITGTSGIAQTTDGGNTWMQLSQSTTNRLLSLWFINANTGYVGGEGGTIMKTINGGGMPVGVPKPVIDDQRTVVEYFPNPTLGIVDFRFTVYNLESMILTVYNAQGQEVAVVFDGELAAGEHTVRWDAGALPAGIYYYQLRAKSIGQIGTGKIVKITND